MSDTLFLGPLIVPVRLLLLVAAGIAGYWALRIRLHRGGKELDDQRQVLDPLGHAFFAGLIIWKFSPLILDTKFVLENPMSLLYFTGGNAGLWLAGAYAIIALGYRTWRSGMPVLVFPDALLTVLLVGGGVYALLMLCLLDGGFMAGFAMVTGLGLYLIQLQIKEPLGSLKSGNLLTAVVVIGLIGSAIHNGIQDERIAMTADSDHAGIQVGDTAADFTLTLLDGSPVRLADYRGSPVLLNFWATWCPPCKAEMPHMEKFYKEMRDQGVVVLGVNLTNTEKSADKVEQFVHERELTFPIVLDRAGQVSDLYRVRAYPTSLIIDSQGFIRSKFQGATSYDSLKRAFRGIE